MEPWTKAAVQGAACGLVFGAMVRRIGALPVPAGSDAGPRKQVRRRAGEAYEKSVEMRYFRVVSCLEEAELSPS